jgi:membrane dipeptidase
VIEPDLLELAGAIHARHPVVECHTDIAMDVRRRRQAGERAPLAEDYLPRLRGGGVRVQFLAVGGDVPGGYDCGGSPAACARLMLDDVHAEVAACPALRVVATAADLDDAILRDQLALVLHFEGLAPALEAGGAAGAPAALRAFHELGLRSVQLTWNGANALADGVAVETPRRLAGPAAVAVRELERLGVLIDVAHLAEPPFWDLLGVAQGPVVCSHANARALCDHPRNLTDEQIGALASTGGYVGVCFIGDFISAETPTLDDLLDHVDHIAALVGTDAVAVGPDYVEFAPDLMLGPDLEAHLGPEELRRVETLPAFTAGLLGRGYSEDDVARILGGNALRVLRQVLPGGAGGV